MQDQYNKIIENIQDACQKSGRNFNDIEIIGVTKTVDLERINHSIELGITHIGENRVQEFLSKYDDLKNKNVKFSMIGHLQSNKVKYIIDKVDFIQSLDSLKLAEEIDSQAKKHSKVMDCLVEVNIGEENSKFGVYQEELMNLLYECSNLNHIRVKGIMSIPPILTTEKTQRAYFENLYKIFIDIKNKKIDNINMDILSMGMSRDYYYAILEGANMVRIGTALYGKR